MEVVRRVQGCGWVNYVAGTAGCLDSNSCNMSNGERDTKWVIIGRVYIESVVEGSSLPYSS